MANFKLPNAAAKAPAPAAPAPKKTSNPFQGLTLKQARSPLLAAGDWLVRIDSLDLNDGWMRGSFTIIDGECKDADPNVAAAMSPGTAVGFLWPYTNKKAIAASANELFKLFVAAAGAASADAYHAMDPDGEIYANAVEGAPTTGALEGLTIIGRHVVAIVRYDQKLAPDGSPYRSAAWFPSDEQPEGASDFSGVLS